MSETRAIKVTACSLDCHKYTRGCRHARDYHYPEPTPESCPLPAWPTVTKDWISQWVHNSKMDTFIKVSGYVPQYFIEDMLKSIGVEVSDA